jgi:L-aspartate oxidase
VCRDATGLSELLDDPYPLARMIGASCLAREESRGAHQRSDRPATDRSLDLMHTLVDDGAAPRFERWQ